MSKPNNKIKTNGAVRTDLNPTSATLEVCNDALQFVLGFNVGLVVPEGANENELGIIAGAHASKQGKELLDTAIDIQRSSDGNPVAHFARAINIIAARYDALAPLEGASRRELLWRIQYEGGVREQPRNYH